MRLSKYRVTLNMEIVTMSVASALLKVMNKGPFGPVRVMLQRARLASGICMWPDAKRNGDPAGPQRVTQEDMQRCSEKFMGVIYLVLQFIYGFTIVTPE